MPIFSALAAAGLAAQVGASIYGSHEQEKARKDAIARQRAAARKQAIQRAIGADFGPANFREPIEPNLTTPAIIGGLGRLGTAIGTQQFGQSKPPQGLLPPLRVPEVPLG